MLYKIDDEIRKYLLGELSESDQEILELRLMTDSAYFQRLLRTEECLTDEYVSGNLTGAEKESFEAHFMKAPERREGVEFARVLSQWASQQAISRNQGSADTARAGFLSRSRWYRDPVLAALVISTIILVSVGGFMLKRISRLNADLALARNEQAAQNARNEELLRRLAAEERFTELAGRQLQEFKARINQNNLRAAGQPRTSTDQRGGEVTTVSALLMPVTRGADRANLVYLTKGVRHLRLELQVGQDKRRTYRVEVLTPEGEEVWRGEKLKLQDRGGQVVIAAQIASSVFTRSDYLVALYGRDAAGNDERIRTYSLKVIRK